MIGKNLINQPVFISNTARPITGKVSFQRFRFTGSVKRISCNFKNKTADLVKDFFIFFLPMIELRKRISMKTDGHSFAACSLAACIACSGVSKLIRFFPSLTSLTALSKCSRLAGDLKRYSVSSQFGSSSSRIGCCRTTISILCSGYASFTELTNSAPRYLELSRYIASILEIIAEASKEYKLRSYALCLFVRP